MNNRTRKLVVALWVSSASWPSIAAAQEAPESNSPAIGEIVVTARMSSESLQDVPESISVISADTLVNAGIRSVQDITSFTPNVQINSGDSPTYTQIISRGMTTPQGAEPPMALVIDGVQLSDVTFFNVDLLNLERIEVLRGPQGSLYGRNAIAGAISITTAMPTNDFSGMVKLGYANGDDRVAQAVISGPIVRDALYFTLSGAYRKSDGTYINDPANRITVFSNPAFNGYFPPVGERRVVDSVDSKSVRAALIYNNDGPLTVALRGSFTDSVFGAFNNELVTGPDDLNDSRSRLASNLDLVNFRKLYEGSLKIDYDFGGVTLTSVTYRNRADQITRGDGDFSTLPALIQNTRVNIDAISQELRLASNGNSVINWLVGSYYQNRKSRRALQLPFEPGFFPFPANLQDSDDRNRSEAFAFFGQATVELTDALQLTAGLRYDHDERSSNDVGAGPTPGFGPPTAPNNFIEDTYDAIQPKFSLRYSWDENFQTYVTIARGFRSGGFNSATATPRQYDAETNWSYELGFKGSFLDNRVFLAGAIYHIELKNEQLYFVTTNPPAANLTNIDRTTKTGFELEMTARPTDGLNITLGVGSTDGIIKRFAALPSAVNNKTPQANNYNLVGSVSYDIQLGGEIVLRPFVSFERLGPIYWSADNTFRTGPKNIVDLRLTLERGSWSFSGFANNVANTRYPVVVGPNSANYAPLGGPVVTLRGMNTPRSYGVEANFRF